MGPVNWIAVCLAAALAVAIGIVWHRILFRPGRPGIDGDVEPGANFLAAVLVMVIGAAMLGHNFARIGSATLAAKPWLYAMQSGGVALAFVVPAVWLTDRRWNSDRRAQALDCGFWLIAYLAMGLVFWALS